jgi:phage/plasmid-associated DNA primase
MPRRFTVEEKEGLAKWAGIYIRSQIGRLNEIIEKEAFHPEDTKEVLLRYLDIDIEDNEKVEKFFELLESLHENFPALYKIGTLILLMSLDNKVYEDVFSILAESS